MRDAWVAAALRAVIDCDPARRVHEMLAAEPGLVGDRLSAPGFAGAARSGKAGPCDRAVVGLAIGKAALAMARGAGEVARGLAIAPGDDHRGLPPGWTLMLGSHPEVDAASVAAGEAAIALVQGAAPDEVVLALISGGASALAEVPTVPLADYRATIARVMAAGVPIASLNETRRLLSRVKGGKLGALAAAPVVTLVVSDVVGDWLDVVGSGPTIVPGGTARLIMPIASFARAVATELPGARLIDAPMIEDVAIVAERLADEATRGLAVAWGEPTIVVGERGEGGRAQHVALLLARHLRGTSHAALALGSDGCDGPAPRDRAWPAGAFVDGTTWDAIVRAGIDPDRAIEGRDAGTALAAVGALVITGRTGINHADVFVVS